jgi:hypothetical protein
VNQPTSTPTKTQKLWKGPQEDGITFSLLSKWINCRHRFYLRVVHGLVEDQGFNHSMEYGSLWHAAEEAFCGGHPWQPALKKYYNHLIKTYGGSEALINKWYNVALQQFPRYLEYWRTHGDEKSRKPLLEEKAFCVPYTLPSGRTIRLRGKWDAIMLLDFPHKNRDSELYKAWMANWPKAKKGISNQENKTKGEIDEEGLLKTTDRNLQTCLYQIALREMIRQGIPDHEDFTALRGAVQLGFPLVGVLYNVIRRPLSDRYAIKQKVAETPKQFYERLGSQIDEKPEHYFKRWKIILTDEDIERFKVRVFHPILETLCDWWEWIAADPADPWRPRLITRLSPLPVNNTLHFQAPWGVYDTLGQGYRGDYFGYLTTGSQAGLKKIKNLYPELTG